MKTLIVILFILITPYAVSQPRVKEYYNRRGEKCEEAASFFYDIGTKNKNGFFYDTLTSYYTQTNTLRSVEIRDQYGLPISVTRFYQDGTLNLKAYRDKKIKKGMIVDTLGYSILEFYDSTGSVMVQHGQGHLKGRLDWLVEQGKIQNGSRDSVWTYFYDNGKVYSYESWQGGKFIDGISYDNEGREFYYKELSSPPFLVGGPSQLYTRMNGNITYPRKAQQKSIEGKVFIEFMVEKNGEINSPRVIKGIGFGCDEEALKAMQASPKWVPAKVKGQPVRYKMTIPIIFKLS